MRAWLPDARGHRRLLAALAIDALGSGLFLPFSILYFTATTDLGLGEVGLALSLAALVRIPATAASGMVCDRFGARTTVIVSNLGQAVGFANYLLVDSFGYLLLAAVVVQLGNSAFWVAYPALVHDVAAGRSQEPWFALITALRHAGLAVGALGASLALALGGAAGYTAIVAVNAASFAVAAALTWLDRVARTGHTGHTGHTEDGEPDEPDEHDERRSGSQAAPSGWGGVLRDLPFLGFVVLNLGFALLSLAFVIAVPVFLVETVGLPAWIPGTVLAVNAVLGALGATPTSAALTGRRRGHALTASQAIVGGAFVAVLCCAYVPLPVSVGLALTAVVLVTGGELVQGLIVPSVVNECATRTSRGRYNSLYQMAFSTGDIITPALMTALLAHGPVTTWTPLLALAALDMLGVALLARRLPALRHRVNRPRVADESADGAGQEDLRRRPPARRSRAR